MAEGTTAESEEAEESIPNTDFCFSKEDFIETQMQMNDATRHQGNRNAAWTAIKELKDKVVDCSNTKDGVYK